MNLKPFLPLLALPLLAACQPEVESTVYLTDIQSTLDKDEAMTIKATLRIPQSGEDDCKKNLPDLIEKLKTLAPVSGNGQCISKDQHGSGTQLAEIETELQLIKAGTDAPANNLFVIEAAQTDEGRTDLTFKMLKPIADVISALQAENPTSVEFDPASFIIHLNNDTSGTVELAGNGIFINGKPVLSETGGTVTVDRRGVADVMFSDVASTYLQDGNSYYFVTIGPAA